MLKRNRIIAKSDISNLNLQDRVSLEATITDARSQALGFDQLVTVDTDLTHYMAAQPWRQYLFGWLGGLQGKTVLDICCGYSMTPVIMALAGARVYAVDVAPKTIELVQQMAEQRGVAARLYTHVGPVEELPFESAMFDLIFGGAALHHLRLDLAGPELARLLKPGGKGAFQEPLAHNKLLEFARDYLSYHNRHPRKGTDRPLTVTEIEAFGRYFATCTWRGFDLLSMGCKVLGVQRRSHLGRSLQSLDQALFTVAPYLQRYARFAVICVTKGNKLLE